MIQVGSKKLVRVVVVPVSKDMPTNADQSPGAGPRTERMRKECKQLLRELQVKWHPDRQSEDADEETKELALELSMKLNEAMRIAKENMRARGEM